MMLPTFEQVYTAPGGYFVSIRANGTWVPGFVCNHGRFYIDPTGVESYLYAIKSVPPCGSTGSLAAQAQGA